jgi:hypothetical protein
MKAEIHIRFKWKEKHRSKTLKQLNANQEVVYKGITSYSKVMELRNLRKVLYKATCNWVIQIKKKKNVESNQVE